jgi:hypothetical protein
MRFAVCLTLAGVVPLLSASVIAEQRDPSAGTWVLDPARSAYQSGAPPRRMTVVIEVSGTEVKVIANGIGATGDPIATSYRAKLDGKDYPANGSTTYDAIAIRQIDRFTRETTRKKGGTVVQTARSVVSPDGKTLTVTSRVTKSMGVVATDVSVYARQRG